MQAGMERQQEPLQEAFITNRAPKVATDIICFSVTPSGFMFVGAPLTGADRN